MRAFITGITGQDGSYLAEYLLEKGYEVHGFLRRGSYSNTKRIDHILSKIHLRYGDLTDSLSIMSAIDAVKPDEIYNLAAQSHVKVSFDNPEYTGSVDAVGVLRILESVKNLGLAEKTKIYQASTSELYGLVQETPQTEKTPFYPRSPYGVAKLYGYWIVKNYRESYGMYACCGILFNHESPRRGDDFVTKKIVNGLSSIKKGDIDHISLGNLNAKRDWGHAKDFVKAMHMILQQPKPEDYVIATGEQYSVRDFLEACAPYFGMDVVWEGSGVEEVGIDKNTGKVVVKVDPNHFRPAEVESLLGNPAKAKNVLGWNPEYTFSDLVKDMCLNEK